VKDVHSQKIYIQHLSLSHTHTHTHTRLHTLIQTYTHTHTHTHLHTHTHTHIHIHTQAHTHTHTGIQNVDISLRVKVRYYHSLSSGYCKRSAAGKVQRCRANEPRQCEEEALLLPEPSVSDNPIPFGATVTFCLTEYSVRYKRQQRRHR